MSRTLITPPLLALLVSALTSPALLAAEASDAAAPVADAVVVETVIEDDSTRIEELRVRGQTQKVTVQPKTANYPATRSSWATAVATSHPVPAQRVPQQDGASGAC
jgi:hypothetical protein